MQMTAEMLGRVARTHLIKTVKENFKSKPEGKGASEITVEMQRMIHETWNYNREGEPLVQEAVVLRRPQAQGMLSELTERMRRLGYVA